MKGDPGIVMRRRSPLEVLDLGMALVRADAGRIAMATLPAWALVAAVAAVLWTLSGWGAVAVAVVLGRICQVPTLFYASDRSAGNPQPVSQRRVARAVLSLVPQAALHGTLSLFAAVIPPAVIYVWGRAYFVAEVVVLERPEAGEWGRIGALAASGSGQVVAARLLGLAVETWAMVAAMMMGEFVMGTLLGLGQPFGVWWAGDPSPFLILGSLAAQPALAAARFAAYLDVRTRRECLDAWFTLWAASNAAGPG